MAHCAVAAEDLAALAFVLMVFVPILKLSVCIVTALTTAGPPVDAIFDAVTVVLAIVALAPYTIG